MPQHELADFFDTFHILVRPVYASIYFPGTALLYVASIWLNLPPWVMPLLAAGASVALLYRVISELVDGVPADNDLFGVAPDDDVIGYTNAAGTQNKVAMVFPKGAAKYVGPGYETLVPYYVDVPVIADR